MSHARIGHRRRAVRSGLVLMLVLFVLAQSLGWLHRGLHGAPGAGAAAVTAGFVEPLEAPAAVHRSGWIDALFGDHADPAECRLFDVMSQPGCLPTGAIVAPAALLSNALIAAGNADFVARWSALFDARGPPPSR